MNKKAKIAVLILGCILVSVFTAGCGKKESEQAEADEVITKEAIIKESIPEETIAEEAVAREDSSGSLIATKNIPCISDLLLSICLVFGLPSVENAGPSVAAPP